MKCKHRAATLAYAFRRSDGAIAFIDRHSAGFIELFMRGLNGTDECVRGEIATAQPLTLSGHIR
jgi:hypothetical protein